VRSVVADLIKHGKVHRAYLGVSIQPVTDAMASSLGLEKAQGVMVGETTPDGAARGAGVKERDVIISVDGREVNQPNELQSYVATRRPGDVVTLRIFRDGKYIEKKVTLKLREDQSAAKPATERETPEKPAETAPRTVTFESLGMTVRPLTAEEKAEAGLSQGGALIESVRPYGEAFNRRLGTNDIIIEADKQPVGSPADLKRAVDARKAGDSILLRVQRGDGGKYFVALQLPKE